MTSRQKTGESRKKLADEAPKARNPEGFGQRLTKILDAYPTRVAAAEVAGVNPDQLPRYVAGLNAAKLEAVARLAMTKGFSLDWLWTGKGSERVGGDHAGDFAMIPVFDVEVSSGHGGFAEDGETESHVAMRRDWLHQHIGASEKDLFIVYNRGDSNVPDILDGDAVLIDRSHTQIIEGRYYVFSADGALLIKKIERLVDGGVLLKSRNPEYAPQSLSRDEAASLRVIGRVRWSGGLR